MLRHQYAPLILKRPNSTYPPILKSPKSRYPPILKWPKSIFRKIEIFEFFESVNQNLSFHVHNAGDNAEKIWVHRFLAKPKPIEAGALGGSCMPPGGLGRCLGERMGENPLNSFTFFLVKHAKMVIVRVIIG